MNEETSTAAGVTSADPADAGQVAEVETAKEEQKEQKEQQQAQQQQPEEEEKGNEAPGSDPTTMMPTKDAPDASDSGDLGDLESVSDDAIAQGILDEQFRQLLVLQDDDNPNFLRDVIQLFLQDAQVRERKREREGNSMIG